MAISCDFIVGFPGESEAEFQATLDLVDSVGYASAFSFKYSPRPGTPAASMPGQVPEPVKAERLARLHALLESQTRAFNAATVGRRLPVLLEKRGRQPGQLIGRSPYLQAVWTEAPDVRLGQVVEIEITGNGPNSLSGSLTAANMDSTASPIHSPRPEPVEGRGVAVRWSGPGVRQARDEADLGASPRSGRAA